MNDASVYFLDSSAYLPLMTPYKPAPTMAMAEPMSVCVEILLPKARMLMAFRQLLSGILINRLQSFLSVKRLFLLDCSKRHQNILQLKTLSVLKFEDRKSVV